MLASRKVQFNVPVITLGSSEATLRWHRQEPVRFDDATHLARRWSQYGLALLGRGDNKAGRAFASALALEPYNSELVIDVAAADLRTTRATPLKELGQRTLSILQQDSPQEAAAPPRARYWIVTAFLAIGNTDTATTLLRELADAYPRDREAARA